MSTLKILGKIGALIIIVFIGIFLIGCVVGFPYVLVLLDQTLSEYLGGWAIPIMVGAGIFYVLTLLGVFYMDGMFDD